MKFFLTITAIGLLVFVLLFSGCTSSTSPVQTPSPANTVGIPSPTLTAVPTAVPFPDALALDEYACFGCEYRHGSVTVHRYEIRPYYNWTSSSWNSPSEQTAASQPLEQQNGFNMEKPREGNTFLIIFLRVVNYGTYAVNAPSANQFVVYSDGKMYNYTPVHSPDVVIDKVSGTQYNFQTGQGGTAGYIQPGVANRAEGYLIYEIPASFSPNTTYVIGNNLGYYIDNQNKIEWKLS